MRPACASAGELIATIPSEYMDGREVMIWWTHAGWCICRYWVDEDDCRGGWRGVDDDCVPINQKDATHWMPMPPPPAGEKPPRLST